MPTEKLEIDVATLCPVLEQSTVVIVGYQKTGPGGRAMFLTARCALNEEVAASGNQEACHEECFEDLRGWIERHT